MYYQGRSDQLFLNSHRFIEIENGVQCPVMTLSQVTLYQ